MKYSFKKLINAAKLQEFTDELSTVFSISTAIISMDGEIIAASRWQRLCVDFHRQHPVTQKDCIKSDKKIRDRLEKGESYVIYKCPRRLIDRKSVV